ncbi:carboxymuconolactone decarboxylase family protein [Coprothermobacter platensis]|uniref:carboxymuconolactone decarboxylase family protein n=1 Tax=Coprothermobacter platensis TaxID=108819 RepID=UPI0003806A6B|nr:carboxymuconolactone decarboxylase family protein [Coprothermobacter platensis]
MANAKEEAKAINEGMAKLGTEMPDVMKAFGELHHAASKDGALSVKEKELIALGIAVSVRCSHCIVAHMGAALQAGATREEIMEALSVAVLMSGGPGVMYAVEAMNVLDDLTK